MKTEDAVRYAGSAASLAELLGVSPSAVSQWDEFPPWSRQLQLERLTSGALQAEPGCESGRQCARASSHTPVPAPQSQEPGHA
ncbi:Cro/CI family transcriptional regulator [Delftia sp. NA_296.1]|uniref:Cro/CI family transcriptional regulator n=1 Tax=Delftia sp. NA_296.1 TaxID=3415648 RepID=UPI004045C77C